MVDISKLRVFSTVDSLAVSMPEVESSWSGSEDWDGCSGCLLMGLLVVFSLCLPVSDKRMCAVIRYLW